MDDRTVKDAALLDRLVNATANAVKVYDGSGQRLVAVLPPSGIVARAQATLKVPSWFLAGTSIELRGSSLSDRAGLPSPSPGVTFVVEHDVALATTHQRDDLLVCGPPVTDDDGRIVGCRGLCTPRLGPPRHTRAFLLADLATLIESETGRECAWRELSPASLYAMALELRLVSAPERDYARRCFGELWEYTGE